jgi:choline dehydrogenase-like flavoprotein
MSPTPKDGVTNPFSGVWDCPNIVVADAGVFVSSPYKNPTLTIMALAMRASEHLLAGVKDGSIAAPS